MSHTPGPWHTKIIDGLTSGIFIKAADGRAVATVKWNSYDAQLIAAAPEMLELLEELQWEYVDPDPYPASHRCPSCRRRREDQHTDDCWIGNVIKKAKGEQ